MQALDTCVQKFCWKTVNEFMEIANHQVQLSVFTNNSTYLLFYYFFDSFPLTV